MRISAQEEYGLRCLLAVARLGNGRGYGEPLSVNQIALAEGLSNQYAAKLLSLLRRTNIVTSTRGASGGFHLARPAHRITVLEALQALGGGFIIDSEKICSTFPGRQEECTHLAECSMRPMWNTLIRHVTSYLSRITVQDLLDEEAVVHHRAEDYMREASKQTVSLLHSNNKGANS